MKTLPGAILLTAGMLIASVSGLCTAIIVLTEATATASRWR